MDRPADTLHGMLLERAARHGDREAAVIAEERLSYERLAQRSIAAAHFLAAQGIGRGDVVATLTRNCAEQAYILFGAGMLGAIEAMINTAYHGDFLTHQLRDAGAKMILVDADLLPAVLAVREQTPDLEIVMVRGKVPGDEGLVSGLRFIDAAELYAGDYDSLPAEQVRWSDPCSIQYTSGTTGRSKGVILSHNALVNLAHNESELWWRGEGDALYAPVPMFHLSGKGIGLLSSLYRGSRGIIDERFSASRFWRRVREEGCSAALLMSSAAVFLWNQKPSDDEGIDVMFSIPVPIDLQDAMTKRWGCRFVTVYGLSEASPVIASDPTRPLKPGSAGRTISTDFDVRIFDDDDREVPAGAQGQVVIRPLRPHVMFEGYLNDPQATVEATRNLWLHTGDVGMFDEEGDFFFIDRQQDFVRRRGENISSFEVESSLMQHPGVIEAAVVAVASEHMEDEVMAYVIVDPSIELGPRELIEHAIERMPYFAVPRYLEIVEELPRTGSGKVRKGELRSWGIRPGCWDREAAGLKLSDPSRKRGPEAAPREQS